METLQSHKFVQYFSAKADFYGSITDDIKPPKYAKEIFMGGGIIGSKFVNMGVFGTPEELFDQRKYPHCQDTEAKSVRKYHAYYDSGFGQPIGFSKRPAIRLNGEDVLYRDDESKLSACTTDVYCRKLRRCGASNLDNPTNFHNTFQIVFYYRT